MLDRPDAASLLQAMAKTLTDEVLPTTSGGTRHSVRVVANLCRILERETVQGFAASERTRIALAELLTKQAPLPELVAELDRALKNGDEDFENRARRVLLDDVGRRLAIDRPGYDA